MTESERVPFLFVALSVLVLVETETAFIQYLVSISYFCILEMKYTIRGMSVGEMSVWEIAHSGNCPSGNYSSRNCLSGNVHRRKVLEPRRHINLASSGFIP